MKNRFLRIWICVLSLAMCMQSLYSQNDFPSLELTQLPCDGTSDASTRSLMETAIILSGADVQSTQAQNVLSRYDSLSKTVRSPQYQKMDSATRAEAVLTLMYDQVLSRYQLPQSSIVTMFENGTYNCVSSSVLYACLATDAGLTVRPLKTTGHAFCQVNINGSWVTVETTNPYGYNPGERKYVSEDPNRYAVVEAKVYRSCTVCSLPMLVSLIAQNRASVAKEQGDVTSSVELMLLRVSLLQNASRAEQNEALDGFLTACNNYAVNDQRKNNYVRALDWLILCKETDSCYWSDTLQSVYDNTLFNQCADYLNAGKWKDASDFLAEYKTYATPSRCREIEVLVFTKYVESTVYAVEPDQAIAFLNEVKTNPLASEKVAADRIKYLLEYSWLHKINAVSKTDGYLAAVSAADQALKALPKNAAITRSRQSCLDNYAVQVHNTFATTANSGKYTEARRILDEGLANYPQSSVLQRDSRTLRSMGY